MARIFKEIMGEKHCFMCLIKRNTTLGRISDGTRQQETR